MANVAAEARDYHGRWTAGGATAPDPRAVEVGGDEWNKQIAAKLENQYAAALPALNALAEQATTLTPLQSAEELPVHQGEDDEWGALSGDDQQTVEEKWKEDNYYDYLQSEQDNWLGNDAPAEAAAKVAEDDDWKAEWLGDYLADRTANGEPRIPYTAQQLHDAIKIDFDRNHALGYSMNTLKNGEDGKDNLDISFDDEKLSEPDNIIKGQMTLPGIEEKDHSSALTPEMRKGMESSLRDAFWDKAETELEHLKPPDYLVESAHENLDQVWSEMDDGDKFKYAEGNTDVLGQYKEAAANGPITMPKKLDPLNDSSGEDYRNTQRLAKYMADHRAAQIMTERGIEPLVSGTFTGTTKAVQGAKVELEDIQAADNKLWAGWKGSSTGSEGRILQVAAADELGGRLRSALHPNAPVSAVGTPEYQKFAKSDVAETGDLDEFKAALQASSDPPGMAQAVKYDPDMSHEQKQKAQEVLDESLTGGQSGPQVLKSETVMTGGSDPNAPHNPFTLLPTVNVMRNGAASMTTDRTVANNWSGTPLKAAQISPEEAMLQANNTFKSIGGYAGVKAAVRAKWETTQYLLDRADIPVVQAYRGINMPHIIGEKQTGDFLPPLSGKVFVPAEGVDKDLAKEPIGSTFTTNSGKIITKVSDSNKDYDYPKVGQWKYDQPPSPKKSVVLRAEVPRTAVLSVPAYGQNIHSEHEVVVAGTGWKGWDAWSGSAPSFKDIPMGTHTPSANAGEPTPDNEAYKSISPKETAELDKTVSELKGSKKAAAA